MNDKKQKYIGIIKDKVEEYAGLKKEKNEAKLKQCTNEVQMVLDNLITDQESKYIKHFQSVSYSSQVIQINPRIFNLRDDEAYQKGIDNAVSIIRSIIFGVEAGLI